MRARELNRLFDDYVEHVERDDDVLDTYDVDQLEVWDQGVDAFYEAYSAGIDSASSATQVLHAWWLVVMRPGVMVQVAKYAWRMRRGGDLDV